MPPIENGTQSLLRLKRLLQMEYNSEREEYRVQLEQKSLRRKIRRGICWYPLTIVRNGYNSLNQLVVEVVRPHSEANDPEPAFEPGASVQFFKFNGLYVNDMIKGKGNVHCCNYTSTVSLIDGDRMTVILRSADQLLDIQSAPYLGLQQSLDETTYRIMFDALDGVIAAKGNRLAELRDLCAGEQNPSFLKLEPMRFPWLNQTQQDAVNSVLAAKDVMVVHGPPGTGKTTTLVEAICETLQRETQVMVCAQSNMAVDWISEKLIERGVPLLRIGNPTRVTDEMLAYTYERQFEAHPDYAELWALRKAIRQLNENKPSDGSYYQKLSRLRDRADELEFSIRTQLLECPRVIACTLVGSAYKILGNTHFSTLFIDEAAQALEPACWIAIRRCSRVILAGDHQQLPATVKCYNAQRAGLGRTLMERLVTNAPSAVSLLRVQYRMNDAIMRFSSNWFYQGQLESDPSVHHRLIIDNEQPVVWIDGSEQTVEEEDEAQDFIEKFVGETNGRINKAEAELTINTLVAYIRRVGRERMLQERLSVGIISPYRAQTNYLRRLVRQCAELQPLRRQISVGTVDGFQGQERDIILISLVRSNPQGQIGFLSDIRRMNVAMTRARMKLFILGSKNTLRFHMFYRKLIDYVTNLPPSTNLH